MITTKKVSIESMYIDTTGMDLIPVKVLGDYRENGASGVVECGTLSAEEIKAYTQIGVSAINSRADSWKNPPENKPLSSDAPACSCCIKKLDDGSLVMGRNMDLPISYAPVVIFRTKGDGKDTYDTVNIQYSAPGNISFDQVNELGAIPKNIFILTVNSACDAFNSQGLYLEVNMRECADCKNESTNPKGKLRVATFNLIRLLADHCANIEEALNYLKDLDIYDPKTPGFDWSMAIAMMDKTGRYGVVEFVNNQVIWNEGREGFACGQANFYWSKQASHVRFGAGLGRWRKLMEYYYSLESEKDVEEAMKAIHYSGFITNGILSKDWSVDWISEVNDKIPFFIKNRLGMIYSWRDDYGIKLDEKLHKEVLRIAKREEEQGGPIWSFEYIRNPANYYDVMTFMDFFIQCFNQLPLEGQKMSGYMECTTIGYTANNKKLGYTNHFFEMNDVYHIGLHETTIDRIPTKKKFGSLEK